MAKSYLLAILRAMMLLMVASIVLDLGFAMFVVFGPAREWTNKVFGKGLHDCSRRPSSVASRPTLPQPSPERSSVSRGDISFTCLCLIC